MLVSLCVSICFAFFNHSLQKVLSPVLENDFKDGDLAPKLGANEPKRYHGEVKSDRKTADSDRDGTDTQPISPEPPSRWRSSSGNIGGSIPTFFMDGLDSDVTSDSD